MEPKSKLWQSRETRRRVSDRQPARVNIYIAPPGAHPYRALSGLRRLSLVCLPGATRGRFRLSYLGLSTPPIGKGRRPVM